MVEIVSVPFDLCGPHHGSRLGSLAMQLQNLRSALAEIGVESTVSDVLPLLATPPGTRAECDEQAVVAFADTRKKVASVLANNNLPLVIGGDHSISIGSISGALDVYGAGLAVLWIDAHMDLNTPDTTMSGNLHGMSFAALARLAPTVPEQEVQAPFKPWRRDVYELWPKLLDIVPNPGLGKGRLAWLGLRDVDQGEVENLGRLPGSVAKTMQDVDSKGLPQVLADIDAWVKASGATALWISFDVDVLDPVFAPGTGTAVRGGLTYREGHLVAETLATRLADPAGPYKLAGVDVVEVNPLRDRDNETAKVAVEWVCSLFGKTIMHGAGKA